MEWKLFEGDSSEFASPEWYEDREAAHHLEEGGHRERLFEAANLCAKARDEHGVNTVSDLGCGDGGLLQVLGSADVFDAVWGYDLQPENIEYAVYTRGVDARLTDFGKDATIDYGDATVVTEVLEHLEDPHGFLETLPSRVVIASCPFTETANEHYEFHLWAWDNDGFEVLFKNAGWIVRSHFNSGMSQFVLATRS